MAESSRTWAGVVAGKPGNLPPREHGMTPTINNDTIRMTARKRNNEPERGGDRLRLKGNKYCQANKDVK